MPQTNSIELELNSTKKETRFHPKRFLKNLP